MKRKIFGILLTLVLVLSFSLVTAVPAAANGTTTTLTVPDNVYRPAEFVASSTTTNSGTAYDTVRFNITVDGPVDFTGDRANTFTITKVNGSSETQGINDTFTLVGGDWVGYWGPETGFPLTDGYDATSTFTIEMCDVTTAPLGNYDVTVELVDLSPEPDVTLATATDSFSLGTDTLYVGTTQYQYQFTTIQSAVDAATGTTITCAAGTYTEAVTIPPGVDLTIVGAGRDVTTWIAPADDPSRMHCIKCNLSGYSAGATALDVSGFTFNVEDNAISTSGIAILINHAEEANLYLDIYDNQFVETTVIPDETANSMLLCHNRYAVRVDGVAPVKIYNNLDDTTGGICMSNTRAFDIYNNIFDGGSDALHIGYGCPTDTTVGDHHIYNNTFMNASNAYPDPPWPSVFFTYHGSGTGMTFLPNIIENNTFEDNDIAIGYSMESDITYPDDVIQFNDFAGNTEAITVWGAHATTVDAENNWWGNASGPKQATTNPRGEGDEVSDNVDYQPWLTRGFQTVLDDNIAYFGYAWVNLSAGWNIASTPIALDPDADTWGEYVALGDPDLHIHATNPAYSFNTQTGIFELLTGSYQLKPCDAIYVRMSEADIAPILYSPNVSVPSKDVYSGWNLVGLANLDEMSVADALISIETVPGCPFCIGYSLVVSPPMNQTPWSCPPEDWDNTEMEPTKGYWVFMINDGTLAGFTFTPQSLPD